MKNKIFNLKTLAVAIAGILLSGCGREWLDIKPLGRFTEEDIPAGSLEGQVFGLYSALRHEGTSGLQYAAIHNIRSDDAELGGGPNDASQNAPIYDDFNYITSHWLMNGYWSGHFNLIHQSNNVLAAVDSLEAIDAATLANLGEAHFFRAYAYFNLVRTFGEVPLYDFRLTNQESANIPKSPVSEIYQLIDADLDAAMQTIPMEWPGNLPGRLLTTTAYALKTKTLMARGMYGAALSFAERVIESGRYDLSVPYNEIFTEARENSRESIFEIQARLTQNENFAITWASRQGIRGAGDLDLGWGWNIPNQRLLDAYEEGDPRRDATVLYSGRVNTPYNEFIPGNLDRAYWNKKVYTNPDVRRAAGNRQGGWFNLRIIRYADIVLLAAEAANETGDVEKALGYLEQVRARARQQNSGILPRVTTTDQEELRQAIRHERQVELGMENERFFDLVRWGIDLETMHAAGKTNYQLRNRFMPIPQPEIDRSNDTLQQNPDY